MGKRTRARSRALNERKLPSESKDEFLKRTTPKGKHRRGDKHVR